MTVANVYVLVRIAKFYLSAFAFIVVLDCFRPYVLYLNESEEYYIVYNILFSARSRSPPGRNMGQMRQDKPSRHYPNKLHQISHLARRIFLTAVSWTTLTNAE